MNGSDINHAFTALGAFFIVLAQTAISPQPGKRALNYPAPRQDLKPLLLCVTGYDIQDDLQILPDPLDQLTAIAAVGPDFPQAGFGIWAEFVQHQFSAIPVSHGQLAADKFAAGHGGMTVMARGCKMTEGSPWGTAVHGDAYSVYLS